MKPLHLLPILLVATSALSAQEGTQWLSLQGGAFLHKNNSAAKNTAALGLGYGAWLDNRWGLELNGLTTKLEYKVGNPTGTENHVALSGLFNLYPGASTWVPYLRGGVGATQIPTPWSGKNETTTRAAFHAGLGVQAALSEHFLASLEARAILIESQESRKELVALLGLGYRWGGGAKPARVVIVPAPAPEPAQAPPPPPAPAPEPKPVEPVVVVAPPPPPPAPAPAPAPPKKIVLDEAVLHFANNQATLSPAGVEAVVKVAGSLKGFTGSYKLVVSGHTSSPGGAALNKSLSKRRAEAVAKVLVDAGIPAASIETVGAGPDQPIADNKTKAGQSKNRRVEIDVQTADARIEKHKTEMPVVEASTK